MADIPNTALPEKSDRLQSIDITRGLIMAVMALDHVRDYFSNVHFRPMDPALTTVPLFFTRWLSHFCAPAFFLLAGIGVFLALARGKSRLQQARYLFSRGVVLVVLDLVVVRVGWDFNFAFSGGLWFIVLSTLGFSMMILAGLIFLPYPVVALFSVVVIGGHNLFDDGLDAAELGRWEPLWVFLHLRQDSSVAGVPFYISYPLLPWVGVMSLGYCLGPIFRFEAARRRRWLVIGGAAMVVAFVALRASNLYGDPRPWSLAYEGFFNVLGFLRTKKYPPSLLYLLMTLGPLLMLLAALEHAKGRLANWLLIFGRVPLFFYMLHLYVIHALAVLAGVCSGYRALDFCVVYTGLPRGYGFGLPVVYAVTLLALIICYPACVWFNDLKRRNKAVWLTYL